MIKTNTNILGLLLCVCASAFAHATDLHWQKQNNAWVLKYSDQVIGTLFPLNYPDLVSKDQVEQLKPGVYRLTRAVHNTQDLTLDSLRLTIDFVLPNKTNYHMIPSVSYAGNTWGHGKEPKGYRHEGTWWSFSSRRTPIPGATYSEGQQWAVALWAEPTEQNPVLSCSLMPESHQTTHRLIWPEEEQPLTYSSRDRYAPGTQQTLDLAPGESLTLKAILVVDKVKSGHRAMSTFMSEAWTQLAQSKKVKRSLEEIWTLGVTYAKDSLWAEEGVFKGFSIGLLWNGNAKKWEQRGGGKYEIGWCGQNASYANSLLTDYLRHGNQESLTKGLVCLDAWANHCALPNGLFRVHFDYVLTSVNRPEVLDSCNLGTAALNYFEAYELAAMCGHVRPQYCQLALNLCDFMKRDQQDSGCYGKGWSPDGHCVKRDGTVGAFMIPPMLKAYDLTGKKTYLDSAQRAFAFYYSKFEIDGFTSAGALDTGCVDKESAMPLLRSALMLHDMTTEQRYLDVAEHVSWYLSTWLWHYSVHYAKNSDFERYGFDSFGGTSVSTQHHHLDPYALFWVKDWLDLAEKTGQAQWKDKALAIWFNACQLVSDGSLKIHGITRPAGAQNEGFMHCAWQTGVPGGVNGWLVAWPGAFRLETLRRLEDWDVLRSENVTTESDWFLMTSHVNEKAGLLLAVSPDGLTWQAVNDDRSVLKPTVGDVFRDPSIGCDASGTYHMVWTAAWNCDKYKAFGYASSKNLIHWSEQRLIPVMQHEAKTQMVWAPELFWDAVNQLWMVHWSSSVIDKFPETLHFYDGETNGRIYYTVTKDFQTFSPSNLLFNPNCLAIDSHLYRAMDDQYYVFYKADRDTEPKRGIMMAKAPTAFGPYAVNPTMITPANEGWAEGPCAITVNGTARLYYAPPDNFGAFESTDMQQWTNICSKITPPGGYRHGTVIRITPAQAERLLDHDYNE